MAAWWPLRILLALCLVSCALSSCPDGESCEAKPGEYIFPSARGKSMTGGNSPYSFVEWPCNLSSKLAWRWEPPLGVYSNVGVFSPVLDDESNLYVVIENSIRKFTPAGKRLWTWHVPLEWQSEWRTSLRKGPSLSAGLLITSTLNGIALALDMATGTLVWSTRVSSEGIGNDYGWVVAKEGVVIGDADRPDPVTRKNNKVYALNATTGGLLWEFRPDVGVWNFQPHLLGDGTVAFQTWDGGVYRLSLADGAVLWHSPSATPGSWTDGGPTAGPNGMFYVVRSTADQTKASAGMPGFLDAYRLSDGMQIWSQPLEQTPYTYPAVGRLRRGAGLSVVTGVGSLAGMPWLILTIIGVMQGAPLGLLCGVLLGGWHFASRKTKKSKACKCCGAICLSVCFVLLGALTGAAYQLCKAPSSFRASVQAFDAETGALQWRHDLPVWHDYSAKGDAENFVSRVLHGRAIPICLPLASSYGAVDASGVFYMGHFDGRLYAIQDRDGDGKIEEATEVCAHDSDHSFSMPGATLGPDLLAVGTCGELLVFRK